MCACAFAFSSKRHTRFTMMLWFVMWEFFNGWSANKQKNWAELYSIAVVYGINSKTFWHSDCDFGGEKKILIFNGDFKRWLIL